MKEKLLLFENSIFLWKGREYSVKSTKLLDLKATIFTNRQTFVMFESELDQFINEIRFLDKNGPVKSTIDSEKEAIRNELIQIDSEQGIVYHKEIYHAEIIQANDRALRISEKLEDVFNELSNSDYDEKKAKKADAMVKLSNAIVSNEMMRFKYLNLK